MSSPSLPSIHARLTTTSSLLLERSRVLSLNLPPSATSTAQIFRGLSALRSDIVKLQDEADLEATGLSVGGKRGKMVPSPGMLEIQEKYEQLVNMFEEDPAGKDKAKGLRIEQHGTSIGVESPPQGVEQTISEIPKPLLDQTRPFRDEPIEEGLPDESAMLAEQQELMNDQDERLNLLSHSIGRQNHLSLQIGSELDLHHNLLEDTDAAMDRTAARLHRARRRLDTVAHEAKQHGSTITIIVLIFVLLILIIVFKT